MTHGVLAGVIRRGNGGILQKQEQVILNLRRAFLQPSAVGVGGLERETAGDAPVQITAVLIQGGGGQGVTTLCGWQRPAATLPSCAGQTRYRRPRGQIDNPAADGPSRPASPQQGASVGHWRDRTPRSSADAPPGLAWITPAPRLGRMTWIQTSAC